MEELSELEKERGSAGFSKISKKQKDTDRKASNEMCTFLDPEYFFPAS